MQYVADFHLHSKYSRAVSKDMILPNMALFGRKKGIDILTVADWTHPLWFREMSEQLEETNEGLYKLKSQSANLKTTTQNSNLGNDLLFILSTEVSSIYSQGGKVRRIHNLLFAPNFETAEKINKELQRRGCNLMADGRPIIGISAKDLLELVLGIDRRVVIVPCHIWTPWFSLYGSNSGFDTIEECFGNYAKHIYGIETGLSSDPEMNWRIPELKTRTILSFSDSHSLAKMAREATILELVKPTYMNVMRALIHPSILKNTVKPGEEEKLRNKIAYSIEFYPEEGKYHYNGHRNCNIVQSPQETKEKGNMCPVCKRSMTIGVMQRVEELAREELTVHSSSFTVDEFGVRWIKDPTGNQPPFVRLIPLIEIVAESLETSVASIKVKAQFDQLCEVFGNELTVILKTPLENIQSAFGQRLADGIARVRKGTISVDPGYDGEYGKVKIWNGKEESPLVNTEVAEQAKGDQLDLF